MGLKRFVCSALGDLANPELVGIIPCRSDFDLGTPNLSRKENITIVASNTLFEESIFLSLKWRPCVNNSCVTLISKLTLVSDNCTYEYDQTETYEPTVSTVWPNRIMQYGSNGLKFTISSPYRRMRVSFSGYMRNIAAGKAETFIKLNFVLNPTAKIFDFLDQQCDSACHDSHDQGVRVVGEYVLDNVRKTIFFWGFYSRHFLGDVRPESKRILAHFNNGQAFHIGILNNVQFGYTCFRIDPATECINKPSVIDWDEINTETKEFKVEISGQTLSIECSAKRRSDFSQFFNATMNGKPGWAVALVNDAIDTPLELATMEQSLAEYRNSPVARTVVFKGSEQPLVVSIVDPICACSNLVGSKASSLAQLHLFTESYYEVPHAFVLTRFAHDAIFEQNKTLETETKKLEEIISGSDDTRAMLTRECEHLQKLIADTPLPDHLRKELIKSLTTRHSVEELDRVSFAVRSSSWGEDEEDMSAAGQLKTVLGVKGINEIVQAVMTCFASKYSYENIEYKRQHGLSPCLPMAVVVQEMVDCEKAGVLFTCDPTNGDDRVVTITANYGLGESVVSGQSEPDSIRVLVQAGDDSTNFNIENVKVGEKKVIINVNNDQNQYDRSQCCLDNDEIIRLAKCGRAIAGYFRCPRDIEWGYKGNQLYLFQSRPVTGLDSYSRVEFIHESDRPSRAENDFCTRANIGEVMPYAIKPMTLSYSVTIWNALGCRMHNKFAKPIEYSPQCSAEVYYDSYHSMFNLRCSALFQMSFGGKEKPIMAKAMEIGFFGREIGDQPEIAESSRGIIPPGILFEGTKYNLYSLSLRIMPKRVLVKAKRVIQGVKEDVRACKLATGYNENKMLGLLNQMRALVPYSSDCWENHIIIIMLTNTSNMALSSLLAKYIKDPAQLFTAMSKFLALSQDVVSAEIPQRISKMSNLIKAKGEMEVENFLSMSSDEALKYIENSSDNELDKEFKDFIVRFGHRCYNEFEIAVTTWRENPAMIVDMLQKNCKVSNLAAKKEENTAKPTTIEQVINSLNLNMSWKDRLIMKHIIGPRSQALVAAREGTKDILIEYSDVLRDACRMLAKELRRNLRIPDEDLFYYIFYDELEPLIREPQPTIVVQAIRRRNMFNNVFSEPWKFDEIIPGYELIPNHMKPNKELDEKLANAPKLYGTPASSGRVRGKVCLVKGYTELDKVRVGDILLTHSTDIAFSPVFPLVSGIITEVGGLISHGAVVAREYGLPSVLGIPEVTRILQDGEEIILDADNGTIIRVGMEDPPNGY